MADRKLPTSISTPPVTGPAYMDKVAEKIGMLFDASVMRPISVTNVGDDYTIELDPAMDGDVVAGMAFYLEPSATNSGPARLRAHASNPYYDLTRPDGTPVAAGDLSAGTVYLIVFLSGAYRVVSGGTGGGAMIDRQVFITAGTWQKPVGLSDDAMILVECWGGGGGGAGGGGYRGGGGGGSYVWRWLRGAEVGTTEVVQVGGGGAGTGNPGATGGASWFGAHLTAYGGGGGLGVDGAGANAGGGGGGGWGSAGSAGLSDGSQAPGLLHSTLFGGGNGGNGNSLPMGGAAGAASGYGGGGGGGAGSYNHPGGVSIFGGAGGAGGQAGAPRGGGGGASSPGGRGEVVVTVIDRAGSADGAATGLVMPDGTAAEPGLPFAYDPDTGIMRTGEDEIALVTGGAIGLRQVAANVGIGVPVPLASLHAAGAVASNSQVPSYSWLGDIEGARWISGLGSFLLTYFSDNSDMASLPERGSISAYGSTFRSKVGITPAGSVIVTGGIRSAGTYGATTAAAANMAVDPAGNYMRSTSSEKYKRSIEAADPEMLRAIVMRAAPIWYRSTCDVDPDDWSWWGLSAESMAAIDPRIVTWRTVEPVTVRKTFERRMGDGSLMEEECDVVEMMPLDPADYVPEGVAYERLTVALISVAQEQAARVAELEERLASLEKAMAARGT
jgi:hypothetical protein